MILEISLNGTTVPVSALVVGYDANNASNLKNLHLDATIARVNSCVKLLDATAASGVPIKTISSENISKFRLIIYGIYLAGDSFDWITYVRGMDSLFGSHFGFTDGSIRLRGTYCYNNDSPYTACKEVNGQLELTTTQGGRLLVYGYF